MGTNHHLLPCRFTLPAWLPPTFRGTAARYVYYLQAAVKYTAAADGEPAAAADILSVSSRAPLHIWPARPQQLESAALERSLSLMATPGGGTAAATAAALPAADGSLLSPPVQSEDMPIKCWEVGPGTAVQDAVAHIIKLASQPAPQHRPHSPARLGRGAPNGRLPGGSDGGRAGSVAGTVDDSRSEISHEPEEVEVEPGAGSFAAAATAAAAGMLPPALQQHDQQQALDHQQQQQAGSGASSPRSLLAARRPSLQRPGQEAVGAGGAARSPSLALLDSGSTLRSYALR